MVKQSVSVGINFFVSLYLMISILTAAGCAQQVYSFEPPMVLKSPPVSLTVEQISNDYKNDPVLADTKYLGKKVFFEQVTVESIHTTYNPAGPGLMWTLTLDYFSSGNVSFQLLDFRAAQQYVQVGYILKLEGVCQGLQMNGFVLVHDCWYQSIKGEIGTTPPRVGGY